MEVMFLPSTKNRTFGQEVGKRSNGNFFAGRPSPIWCCFIPKSGFIHVFHFCLTYFLWFRFIPGLLYFLMHQNYCNIFLSDSIVICEPQPYPSTFFIDNDPRDDKSGTNGGRRGCHRMGEIFLWQNAWRWHSIPAQLWLWFLILIKMQAFLLVH